MTAQAPIGSVLVVSDLAHHLRGRLEPRLPGLRVAYVERADDLADGLADARPEAVLTIKLTLPARVDQQLILNHPSVAFVQVGGSGYEHLGSWDPRRVTVANSAGVLARFLAETVTGAILALNGNFPRYLEQQRERRWQQQPFRPLAGQTLLIVGLGAIGGHVAANAAALGLRVLAVNRTAKRHPAVAEVHPFAALDRLLAEADIVSLHVRANEETRRLLDRRRIARMKAGAMLINTSRGSILEEAALVEALAAGRIGSAYLDVFEEEPLPAASPLWGLPNVLLTPHASDNTSDWVERFGDFFAENVGRWNRGEPVLNVVTP